MELQQAGLKTKRKLHAALRIDMTPMVDLGFLLITFFIFTTTMSEPRATSLVMPAEGGDPMFLSERKALTVLLGQGNKVVAYEGRWEDAVLNNKLIVTSYNTYEGIGKLVRAKQQWLEQHDKEGRKGLMLLIKPDKTASYKNLIDALDETLINNVKKYAILEPSAEEKTYLEKNR